MSKLRFLEKFLGQIGVEVLSAPASDVQLDTAL
jgi:hypothetical protein